MIPFISFIITMILILNGHGWWAVAFFIVGTLALLPGSEGDD